MAKENNRETNHNPTLYDFKYFKPQKKVTENDPDIWGHIMEPIDPKETLRLLLQNPNGIQPHFSYSDFLFSLHVSENVGVGILSMPETNMNWQPHHISATKKCFKKNWEHSCIQCSQSEEEFENTYKPGGTLTAVMGTWTSRVIEKGIDPYGMGRWSYIVLRGKKEQKIYIVTVYRVCDKKESGSKTAYRQQYRKLSQAFREQKISNAPDPHCQCILDLQAWLEVISHQNHAIILSLDSNEDISDKEGKYHPLSFNTGCHPVSNHHDGSLATLITTCGLIDSLAIHHKQRPFPATYNRGSSRLDYILVSSCLLPAVTRSGILLFQSIFYSDHRPCFIDIDPSILFEEKIHDITPPCQRQLQLHDPALVEKYNLILQQQLSYHRIPEKIATPQLAISKYQWNQLCQTQYERIDALITQAMHHAER